MNDIILFMAGGLWVFVMAIFIIFIKYLKNRFNDKNDG